MICSPKKPHGDEAGDHLPEGPSETYTNAGQCGPYQAQYDDNATAEAIRQYGHGDLTHAICKAKGGDQYAGLKVIQTETFPEKGQKGDEYAGADMMTEMG